jgi:hypothetical protein
MQLPNKLQKKLAKDRGWPEPDFLKLAAQAPWDLSDVAVLDPLGLASCTKAPQTFVDCTRSICVRQGDTVFGNKQGTVQGLRGALVQCDATLPSYAGARMYIYPENHIETRYNQVLLSSVVWEFTGRGG